MQITMDQLIVGFTERMTVKGLAVYLQVSEKDVRARLSALTSEEEHLIDQALGLV
jgi:hypothetical protein